MSQRAFSERLRDVEVTLAPLVVSTVEQLVPIGAIEAITDFIKRVEVQVVEGRNPNDLNLAADSRLLLPDLTQRGVTYTYTVTSMDVANAIYQFTMDAAFPTFEEAAADIAS